MLCILDFDGWGRFLFVIPLTNKFVDSRWNLGSTLTIWMSAREQVSTHLPTMCSRSPLVTRQGFVYFVWSDRQGSKMTG